MFAPNNTEHVSMVWSVGRAGTASSSRCRRNGGSACSRSECGMFACECPTFFPDFFFFRSTRPQINRRSRLRPHPAASGHHPHWQSPYCTTDNDRSVFRCSCRVNGVVQVHGDREEHQEGPVNSQNRPRAHLETGGVSRWVVCSGPRGLWTARASTRASAPPVPVYGCV